MSGKYEIIVIPRLIYFLIDTSEVCLRNRSTQICDSKSYQRHQQAILVDQDRAVQFGSVCLRQSPSEKSVCLLLILYSLYFLYYTSYTTNIIQVRTIYLLLLLSLLPLVLSRLEGLLLPLWVFPVEEVAPPFCSPL